MWEPDARESALDKLTDALDEYLEARGEYQTAREGVEYDWDYFGAREIDALNRAKLRFGEALDAYVRLSREPV